MKKSSFIKILSIFFIMFIFATNAYSATKTNTLAEVKINTTQNNIININLLFKNNYKEKAFLQKQQDGSYYVFLPNTSPQKNTKVTYDNMIDRQKIRLTIEGKTAIKDEKNYSYTKITTDINPNYGIKLISTKQGNPPYINFIIGAIILFLFLFIRRNSKKEQINNQSIQNISFNPENYQLPEKEVKIENEIDFEAPLKQENSKIQEIKEIQEKKIEKENKKPQKIDAIQEKQIRRKPQEIQETTIIKRIKTTQEIKKQNQTFKISKKASFDCFDIPQNIESNKKYEFKSMLKQTSNALNNKITTITHKHSNPIIKIEKNEPIDLKIPSVEEVIPKIEQEQPKATNNNLNLISVLNITPNKGFYLASVGEEIGLFGFVNKKVFLLNKFKDLNQINLQARFYDKSGNNDIYIVRLDSFKAMIEISDNSMKELARI